MSSKLNAVPTVRIDETGVYKYIQIKVYEQFFAFIYLNITVIDNRPIRRLCIKNNRTWI